MRKQPAQARSRQMVDALIEATRRTIIAKGWAGTTTIDVAARAGVSVGSLYQYFPNKESLVAALAEREMRRLTARLDLAMPTLATQSPETMIRTCLDIAFDTFEADGALFTELAHNRHVVPSATFVDIFEAYMLDIVRSYLSRHAHLLVPIDIPTIAFMMSNGIYFVISRYFSDPPRGVTRAMLIGEITALYTQFFVSKLRT